MGTVHGVCGKPIANGSFSFPKELWRQLCRSPGFGVEAEKKQLRPLRQGTLGRGVSSSTVSPCELEDLHAYIDA
jgi:hypothetical protein